jgi:hypothetical protein
MEAIPTYHEREEMKKEGWHAFSRALTPYGKAAALLRICDAHYWRQREFLEDFPDAKKYLKVTFPKKYFRGYELDIDHYTPHWLHSMRHLISEEVMEILKDQWGYEPVASKFLPDGHTSYVWS